ncbi:PP2C family serine/threonine-protein phosphatase [Nostoc sp. DSM 114159]
MPEQEDTELINSPDLSTEHSDPQGVSEQTEKTITQEYVKLEKATSETSEPASITQALASSEEFIDIQENLTTWKKWRRVFDAVVGSSHLRVDPPIPCQDSALSVLIPRPAIFVADGAGSARLSHFGSSAVVRYLNRFTASIEDINQEILDKDRQEDREIEKKYAYRVIKYAIEILKELSEERQESFDLFRCTLLITIIGINKLFWLKVGDGFIVVEKGENLELLGSLGKGDFANQTTFLTEHLTDKDIHYGFIDVQNVTGIAAFTDGAGEKLVSNDGLKISGALSKFFQGIRTREFTQTDLNQFLSNKEIWQRTTGDDKGIAILSSLL